MLARHLGFVAGMSCGVAFVVHSTAAIFDLRRSSRNRRLHIQVEVVMTSIATGRICTALWLAIAWLI